MVAIVIEPNLERRLSPIKEVERWGIIPHQRGQALGYCSASSLDDGGLVSRLHVTTLQFPVRNSLFAVSQTTLALILARLHLFLCMLPRICLGYNFARDPTLGKHHCRTLLAIYP